MTNRTVVYAKFHQALHLPGLGIGDTLPSSSKTFKLEMYHSPDGLQITVNGQEAVVPWANVVIAKYAPVEKPSPLKVA